MGLNALSRKGAKIARGCLAVLFRCRGVSLRPSGSDLLAISDPGSSTPGLMAATLCVGGSELSFSVASVATVAALRESGCSIMPRRKDRKGLMPPLQG